MITAKPCYDGGVCRNEDAVEDLAEALEVATDALAELERRGVVETEGI